MVKALIPFFVLCIFSMALYAQDDFFDDDFVESTFIAEGKGSSPEGAMVEARVEAMNKFLKLNMDASDFQTHGSAIEGFLRENFRQYTTEPNIIEPYHDRKIRVMVEVNGDILLKEIKQKFLRARSKAAGIWVSINADKIKSSNSLDIVLSTVQNELGKHFTIRDAMAMKELMKKEGQMLDLSASSDPKNYVWRDFSSIPIAMYFWLKIGVKYDNSIRDEVYRARIGARAVHVVTGQEFFQFQHDKIGSERDQTIIQASMEVAQKIVTQVGQYNTILPEKQYTYKFVNFTNYEERDKIKKTMLDMKNGRNRYLDILPGGIGGGETYFTYEVKWLAENSQFEMIQIVLEQFAANEVRVKCDKFTTKVMIFEPPGSNWQEGHASNNNENYPQPDYPEPIEDDCNYIEVEARGSSLRGAIAYGWKKAMMKFLKDNIDYEYYEGRYNEIESFIASNYKEYTIGDPSEPRITSRYDGRRLTMEVCIDEEALLADIRNLVKKADDKLEGLWVALVADKEKNPYQDTDPNAKDELTDRDVMFDTVQNLLGKHAQIRDLRAIERLMKTEAQMLNIPAGADPQSYIARKFAQVQIVVYMWLTTRRIAQDPATGTPVWYATVGCRLVHIQTAQELIKFQLSSGDKDQGRIIAPVGVFGGVSERMARAQAIENVSKACYAKIYDQIRKRKTVLEENVYTIKFVNFTSREERKIKDAILDLKSGKRKYCNVESSTGGGSGYIEYKLKWRRTSDSQADIIDIIMGYCEDNEVYVDSNKSTQGVIYFEPGSNRD